MSLEDLTGTNKFITNLVPANPGSGDDKREGDDHIRGTKNVLVNTFPALNGVVTATPAQLNSTAQGPFLPLAGVTPMTGPLNGTTANFSGAVTLGDALADTITIGGGSSKSATGNWTFAAPSSGSTLVANTDGPTLAVSVVGTGNQLTQGFNVVNANTGDAAGSYLFVQSDTANLIVAAYAGAHTTFPSATRLFSNGPHTLALGTDNTDRITIGAAGNVTIAAPSSGNSLTVDSVGGGNWGVYISGQAATTNRGTCIASSTTGAAYHQITNTGGNYYIGVDNSTGSGLFGTAYALSFGSESAQPVVFATNNIVRLSIAAAGNVTIAAATSGPTLAVEPDPTFPAVEVGFRGMPEIDPQSGVDIARNGRGKMTYVTSGAVAFNAAYAYVKDDVYSVFNNSASNMSMSAVGVTFLVNGAFTTAAQTVLPYRLVTVIFITTTTALVVGIE